MTALQDVVNNYQSVWNSIEIWHVILVCVAFAVVLFIAKNRVTDALFQSKRLKEFNVILFSLLFMVYPVVSVLVTAEYMNERSFKNAFEEAVIADVESNFDAVNVAVDESHSHRNGYYATVQLQGEVHTVVSDLKYSEEFGMMIPYATDVEDMPDIKEGSTLENVLTTQHPSELDVNSVLIDDRSIGSYPVFQSTFLLVISWLVTLVVLSMGFIMLNKRKLEGIMGFNVVAFLSVFLYSFGFMVYSLDRPLYHREYMEVVNYNIENQYDIAEASIIRFNDGMDEVSVSIKIDENQTVLSRFYLDEGTGMMKQYVNKNTEPLAVREE